MQWVGMFNLPNMSQNMHVLYGLDQHVTAKGQRRKELLAVIRSHPKLKTVLGELSKAMGYKDSLSF